MATAKLDNNTVYLIDGSGYIFRAYFAIRSLHSKKGVPTNAVYGFTTMLLKLLREHKPKLLAIAFDRKEPNFRHQLFPEYKANRSEPPKDLIPQFALIHQVVEAFNIKLLSMAGYEADDLIGTVAEKYRALGHEVVIVTGDKDLMQLVDDQTFLIDELRAIKNGTEELIDSAAVKSQLGVLPHQVVDLLALAGDSSDNIPGVAGIGKKTAVELIDEFGSLERILEMAPLVKQNSRREKLIDGHNMALLSKKLVTIKRDVPIDCDITDLRYEGINQEKSRALFSELDFIRLLNDKQLFADEKVAPEIKLPEREVDTNNYRIIRTSSELDKLLSDIKPVKKIAIKAQGDKADFVPAKLIGLALSWGDNNAAYVPIEHAQEKVLPLSLVQEKINPFLSDASKEFIAHNAKYEFKVLQENGLGPFRISGDPALENYLLLQDSEKHGLLDLSLKYLNHQLTSYETLIGGTKPAPLLSELELSHVAKYACERADCALGLEKFLLKKVDKERLAQLYTELELPLETVLARMEMHGVRIDSSLLETIKGELKLRLAQLEKEAYELAGQSFNLASPKQVAEILFERLKLATAKKTKTGHSTDVSVLEKLAEEHPLPRLLLEHRMCAKLLNTYVDSLPHLIDEKSGRLHTHYNQMVTATGRLSSSDPNLQNIPIRTNEGRRIRQAFIADAGKVIISLDYSQVELRLLAYASKDPVLLDSFAKNEDVHKRTASEIFAIAPEQVNREQRNAAKTINFGLLYGMGPHKLAQTLNISRAEAMRYLEIYFQKYAGILLWKEEVLKKARESLEVRTLFGRKRALPELASKNKMLISRAERLAINTPIQGTAADIIKKAMLDTDLLLRDFPGAALIMQVHDELVIEAAEKDAALIAEKVSLLMSKGHGLAMDLRVEYGIGPNWELAH